MEQAVWVDGLSGPCADLRKCAHLLDAAAEVVDFHLEGGIAMEVAAMCGDGSAPP